jgi:uncharacterized protein (DUF1499 family)
MRYALFGLVASVFACINLPGVVHAQAQRSPHSSDDLPQQLISQIKQTPGKLEGTIRKVPRSDTTNSTDAPLSIQEAEQAVRNFQLVARLEGYEFYLDPATIIKQNPFVRFWSYVVLPPTSQKVAVANAYTAVDCGAEIVKIYEIINYNRRGEIVSSASFSLNDIRPSFGLVNHEFVKAVCPVR